MDNWKEQFPQEGRYFETDNGILYNGDCIDVMNKLPEHSIDLVITDPPYGVNSDEMNGIDYKDRFYDVYNVSRLLFKVLKDNTRQFVFSAQKTFMDVVNEFINNGFLLHQTLIWFRPNLVGGTKKKTYDFTSVYEQILNFQKGKPNKLKKVKGYNNFDVLKYQTPQSNFKKDKRYHIHQKPFELIKHLILVSTKENDLILDCFGGSGTTGVVQENINRRWILIEINKDYCEIQKQRILNYREREINRLF